MNLDKLKGHLPDNIYNQLHGIQAFGADGPITFSHFLGQCKTECGFTTFTENLNYSAKRLQEIFSKYFPTIQSAAEYANQPERIGNRIYANRMGNGDEQSGDGYRYRGRGAIQLTGKNNYKEFGDFIKVDLLTNPDLVATTYQLASAGFFFKKNNLWAICNKGVNDAAIEELTKRINGGKHGLSLRIKYTREFFNLLTNEL